MYAIRDSALPFACVFAECTRGTQFGCPRPEYALLDRVTLNIRGARVPHARSLPLASDPGIRDSRARYSRHEISGKPDQFTGNKHMSGALSSDGERPVSSRISNRRHAHPCLQLLCSRLIIRRRLLIIRSAHEMDNLAHSPSAAEYRANMNRIFF